MKGAIAGIIACMLLTTTYALAQPSSSNALKDEINALKQTVQNQEARIATIEGVIAELRGSGVATATPTATSETNYLPPKNGWQIPSNWSRIKNGMSESQVIAILGNPTSNKDLGPYRTLFYRGEVAGSGSVSGNIELTQDRVWQSNIPVF